MMFKLLTSFASVACAATLLAQTPAPTFIKGDLTIRFNTRQLNSDGKVREGVTDLYTMNVNVSDSALFRGTIEHRPHIAGTFGVAQAGLLTYAVDLDVVNPKKPTESRNVGKLFGTVPVDQNNVYRFGEGALRISVFPMGNAKGFDSKFTGLALGKPPAKGSGWLSDVKKDVINFSKSVKGQSKTIAVTKYDKMEFQQHGVATGPVQIYPEATVNGAMIYDYGRSSWLFQNVTVAYVVDGKRMHDTLTGNIRWVESANRKTSGEGEYQFDIRVNEPAPGEAAVYDTASDESAFFETDTSVASLTGTMKYKDSMSGETVTGSAVTIALTGNQLTKQQTMYLAKLLLLSAVVPLNSE